MADRVDDQVSSRRTSEKGTEVASQVPPPDSEVRQACGAGE